MQVIQITSLTGHSPYDITICDITNIYCYSGAVGVTTVPLTIEIPIELLGVTELLVVVTDSIGCEEIQYHYCGEPIPSPTPTSTQTPTPTPTNVTCNCISIENPTITTLNFGFTQCDGLSIYDLIYSSTTLYVCGRLPYGDIGLIITTSSEVCSGNVCTGPTPTPTTTPTPTPTLPPIVGYFQDSCVPSYEFILSNIPFSFSPLSGVYYIESSGYVGCATYIGSTTSTNVFSFVAMGSQPSVNHCQIANFIYPCSTQTPTPTPTITITPTNTLTPTPTQTSAICIPELIYSGEIFTNLPLSNGSSFKLDGTVLYITIHNTAGGSPNDSVCAYSLLTPWDVSTITLPRIGCSIASPVSPTTNYGQYFSPDGYNLFLANGLSNCILKYTLSTPWDVTTSSYSPGNLFSGGTLTSPGYLEFSPDGLFMFVTVSGGLLKKYSLTTPWVINTGVVESQSISFNSNDFTFQNNGTYLFSLIFSFGLTIRRQTLTTPYDLNTIVSGLTQTENVSGFIPGGSFFSITFKDGYKGFISGYYSGAPAHTEIYAFNLTCEYDISGIVILPTPTPTVTPTPTPTQP